MCRTTTVLAAMLADALGCHSTNELAAACAERNLSVRELCERTEDALAARPKASLADAARAAAAPRAAASAS